MSNCILLVEDTEADEVLIKRSLKKSGVVNDINVARDGAEAIEYLFGDGWEDRALPTLVLLDLKLPKLDGHQVLEKIRENERTKLLPVVILTSSDEESDIVRSYKGGANSYVQKPVNFDELSTAVRNLGLYWMVTNIGPDNSGE